ncbi:MAG: tRNA-dihydrouridine synthase [Planctomycetaceae bacterium]
MSASQTQKVSLDDSSWIAKFANFSDASTQKIPTASMESHPPDYNSTKAPRLENPESSTLASPHMALHLGQHALHAPFVQAALSGYSDWPMRTVSRLHGASYTLHEVMIDRFVREVRGTKGNHSHFRVTDDDHPVGAQLMGAEPAHFGPAARRLVDAGFDVIDVNFGCPVKSALGGCRGGYHLGQPQVAIEILQTVRDSLPPNIPVTVKMRRGIDDSPESRERFFKILEGAYHVGIAAVTLHGRTVEQKYVGPSDWSFLKQAKEVAGRNTLLGSGDLFTATDCLNMIHQTGVDGVTIARGSIGNPWIFSQCLSLQRGEPLPPPPDVHAQREVIETHARLSAEVYGEAPGFSQMRKFSIKYAKSHPEPITVRNAFALVKTPVEWKQVLDTHYRTNLPGIYPDVNESSPEN